MLEALTLFIGGTVKGIFSILGSDDVRSRFKRDDVHRLVRIQVSIQQVINHLVALIGAGIADTIYKDFIELKLALGIFQASFHPIQGYSNRHTHSFGFVIIGHPT